LLVTYLFNIFMAFEKINLFVFNNLFSRTMIKFILNTHLHLFIRVKLILLRVSRYLASTLIKLNINLIEFNLIQFIFLLNLFRFWFLYLLT